MKRQSAIKHIPSTASFVALLLFGAMSLQAEEWTVYNTSHTPVKDGVAQSESVLSPAAQLAYAITNAAKYAYITIKPGEYDLTELATTDKDGATYLVIGNNGKKMNLRGENTTHWSKKTAGQETVLKGGSLARIIHAGGTDAAAGNASSFSHLVFDGGNAGSNNGGAIFFSNDGGKGYGFATNCVFRNCSAKLGGATYAVTAYDCSFSENSAVGSGAAGGGAAVCTNTLRDCVFCCNKGTSGGAGAAVYKYKDGEGLIKNCTFTYNYAEGRCGGVYVNSKNLSGTIENCTFHSNTGSVGTSSSPYFGGHIFNAENVRGCKFSGEGNVYAKNIENCEFNGCEYTYRGQNAGLYALVVFDYKIGDGVVRNCLFHDCNVERLLCSGGVWVDIENCTFAGNTSGYNMFTALRDKKGDEYYGTTNVFLNCVFSNPPPSDESAYDFHASISYAIGCNILSNCLFWSTTEAAPKSSNAFSAPDLITANPRFVAGSHRYPDAPYYMLRPSSKGYRTGQVVLDWMADAKDIAGNNRLDGNGKVDIGCYQCDLKPLGFSVSFK